MGMKYLYFYQPKFILYYITRGENENKSPAQVSGIGQNLLMGRIEHSKGPFENTLLCDK